MTRNESSRLERIGNRVIVGTLTSAVTGTALVTYGHLSENNIVSTAGFIAGLVGVAILISGAYSSMKEERKYLKQEEK